MDPSVPTPRLTSIRPLTRVVTRPRPAPGRPSNRSAIGKTTVFANSVMVADGASGALI